MSGHAAQKGSMKFFVFLISSLIHLSKTLLLPLNSTVLQLSSQDTTIAADSWPVLPYQRAINNELIIRITKYGDILGRRFEPNVLQGLLLIRQIIDDAGDWTDVLEEITTVGQFIGGIYTEVGFYSLCPPSGITRSQADQVLEMIGQLLIEYYPPREMPSSTILAGGSELALFRLSLAQRRTLAL